MEDSLLNGINETGLSHKHRVKVLRKPGATSERILDEIDDVIKSKPEHLVIHVGTNDLTNGIDLLNNANKIHKKINEKLPKTYIAFSSIINKKDRKGIDKRLTETNQRLKNYCRISIILKMQTSKRLFRCEKAPPKSKSNSCCAKILLKYLNIV